MTDRTDHRAAAEGLLNDADEWAAQAGELSPEASERACLDRAQVHALLAIHDALADLKPEPVTYLPSTTHSAQAKAPEPEWNFNEVRWRREVMPWDGIVDADPIGDACAKNDAYAANEAKQREAAQEATGGDLSASEGESEAEAGGDDDDTPEALLCPACGEELIDHPARHDACSQRRCRLTSAEVARALIDLAGGRRG